MLDINFIGCGKVGKTLGRLITMHQLGNVKDVVTTSLKSAEAAVEFIGAGKGCTNYSELSPADIYFITTQDDQIEMACNELLAEAKIKEGAIFIHCSGSLSSEALREVGQIRCYAFSVHPVKSFANPKLSAEHFSGTYCGYEGDEVAFPVLHRLFAGMGAILFPVTKAQKAIYHAAGVIANNYLVGLHHVASECYQFAGVDEKIAYQITSMLMQDALQNLQQFDHKKALTGPLQRGDIDTIRRHLSQLITLPQINAVYTSLGKAIIPITEHTNPFKETLTALFQGEND
ncbi:MULTISPECIES: Rossmann-like and DUF2520 domain-containing protein [Legionella]|uniref:DUF2520 domain-containing protein n=1 Tax=Legionella maceachernii TaxID=466 RepID=A0A0W0WGI2_9GAMM|nr:DUF2520 domain-containing protein [Legionella maceachernii]KTD31406.1 hypothetical protein Lmac_0281 [Legionella maceachernii]SKA23269.1 Predicted oxidoreductase, contains short-chain dehydrogenase (SDR) and DUF2520 domains [Legionella maceachernii]SUQ35553.1 Uncharacterized conserved protein [Legionella maceachernii]